MPETQIQLLLTGKGQVWTAWTAGTFGLSNPKLEPSFNTKMHGQLRTVALTPAHPLWDGWLPITILQAHGFNDPVFA